jgi:hypothetical protein
MRDVERGGSATSPAPVELLDRKPVVIEFAFKEMTLYLAGNPVELSKSP